MRKKVPILLIIFNRPDQAQLVFDQIKRYKPAQFFIAADGPRTKNESKICLEAQAIVKQVDWDCEVKTLFRTNNLGCGKSVASAIDWFFSQVDQGIILEDDCVPNQSFFQFCEELLEYYKDNIRVMHISGSCFQPKSTKQSGDYYFSIYPHVWGWATWKRAWKHYSFNIGTISETDLQQISSKFSKTKQEFSYWQTKFKSITEKKIDTWDYQWVYTCWRHNGLSISPYQNMITNIGFHESATHTKTKPNWLKPATEISFPLTHPDQITVNYEADAYTRKVVFNLKFVDVIFTVLQVARKAIYEMSNLLRKI